MNPFVNTIAITNGLIGISTGVIMLMPSMMAFDAPNVKPSMVLLGCSGLSVIPITITATTVTMLTGDLGYQLLYTIPAAGIGTSFVLGGTE